jgi:CRISPR system Cascade subunit CasE
VLFRNDEERGQTALLVQSRVEPDWASLPAGYLRAGVREAAAVRDLDVALASVQAGRRLRFRLRANPTQALPPKGASGMFGRGQRVGFYNDPPGTPNRRTREQKCLDWLARKGEQGGFRLATLPRSPLGEDDLPEVPDVRVVLEDDLRGFRRDPSQEGARRRLTLNAVLFEGVLVVTDADLLRATVASGIGAGKAYGCGLLSLARG